MSALSTFVERPLTKGVYKNFAGQTIPQGGFVDISNYYATERGLYRFPGYKSFALEQTFDSGEPVGVVTLWETGGTQSQYLVTTDQLWQVGELTGLVEFPWVLSAGTVKTSGASVVATGASFVSNGVVAGDWFTLQAQAEAQDITTPADSGGSLQGAYFLVSSPSVQYAVAFQVSSAPVITTDATVLTAAIATNATAASNAAVVGSVLSGTGLFTAGVVGSVVSLECLTAGLVATPWTSNSAVVFTSTTTGFDATGRQAITGVSSQALVLDNPCEQSVVAGSAYVVYTRFQAEQPDLVDWAIADNELVVVTRQREPAVVNFSNSTVERFITTDTLLPTTGAFKAGCCTVFNDRLFVGDIYDATDGRQRQRVRWSTPLNKRDFSTATAYYDIPYTSSNLKRLVPMGPVLVAYFGDKIYFGQPTENPGLPVVFNEIETGGIGLVGQRAVVPVANGHFFVGQDNVYFLNTEGFQPVGNAIARDTIQQCKNKWRIQGVLDARQNRVAFGIPDGSDQTFTKVWSFDYRSEAWACEVLSTNAYMLANPALDNTLTWGEVSAAWGDMGDLTWGDLDANDAVQTVIVDRGRALVKQQDSRIADEISVESSFVTRDMDGDAPDDLKTFVRLALKVEWTTVPSAVVTFSVEGSVNKGYTWKSLGELTIAQGRDEGAVDFALLGSTARFRVTTTATTYPFYISEFTLRVRSSGRESGLGTQD